MATNNIKPTNTITGKVLLKETGAGIPDLLVVIYDLDPGVRSEETFGEERAGSTIMPTNESGVLGDRIGSVLTLDDGSWSLGYEDPEFRINNPDEKRPDLQLMVLAPEDADSDQPPTVLFSSKMLRVNSGRQEAYLIRITSEQLLQSKIALPQSGNEPEDIHNKVLNFKTKKEAQRSLKKGIREVNKAFIEEETEERVAFRKTIRNVLLPNSELLQSRYNFVNEEMNTIEEVQEAVVDTGANDIETVINDPFPNNPVPGKGIKINLILTADEKQQLQQFQFDFQGEKYYKIPEAKIQEVLLKREKDNGVNAILFSDNPISKFCIQKTTKDKCAEKHTALHAHHENGENPELPVEPVTFNGITKEDIPFYLEKILAGKDSLQFQTDTSYKSQRPDEKSVQAKVDSFALHKGPADTTAFYDFHSLQIAFSHVWQQLFDETIVNLSEKVQHDLENTGRKGLLQSIQERLAGVKGVGVNVLTAAVDEARSHADEEVPTDISAAFDITFIEYDALTTENKNKLSNLAKDINKYEIQLPVTRTTRNHITGLTETSYESSKDYRALASVLRDQGERIIDNIRINKPFTTNQLLKELQEKLLAKYEFTVFAANKDYHSVNFGIMNTFRQKWEPISYQAGRLINTIPLSPKEERKFTVKTSFNVKTIRKEARKNNSSIQREINTTSRAESEIIAKAQDKSNFNMSVNLDYSKIKSEVKFGKDAQKDASQAKKEFRESVIKAAQEYKEERSVEINTEETFSSEFNESGTLVNPNDELSVTYLFYELQRRYRISEQLYRVMPVVLVAQAVPSPDQINESWIIAHDWILNRVLLDDSFRETLQYLAQKNVGDDFAIRELRKNLSQQRTLVNNLQLEFSKLKTLVDDKYASLQSQVNNRIDEEHNKRFYKWWWWWGQNNKPDTPPDPEMAKAMEQAAADDHKHAVEQAEKMSMSLQREVNNLHQLTVEYNNVMREHLDRITQTRRLIVHIKNNILFYMQAIWSMEPPDQRFMRLHNVRIPQFDIERTCIVQDKKVDDLFGHFRQPGKEKHVGWMHGKIIRDNTPEKKPVIKHKDLVEVADLDTLLGFKGNYMIFPLKEHNPLTELMAEPYIDEAFGAMDPDELSNISLEDFSKYVCCLHDEYPEQFAELEPVLKEWLGKLLSDPLRNGDEIIVPTGSMFIEMLPSDKTLLEDFKLKHREWDVFKVQAEVRKMELENIRYAARLLNSEREDPDIERQIVVHGKNGVHIDVDD
ncbi:hypothetical protein BH23BAC1_BH23BAC1_36680 [soil metagenome]